MFKECCIECGHLLSKQRTLCPFCGWSRQAEQWLDSLASDGRWRDLDTDDVKPDQLFASNAFQSAHF